ncbi:MAG: hypothetical protein WBA24_05380 [Geitlerinemataceae cyanobacterium]
MNLPFVVDIAIGLMFTYLTLSLLSSEIQELLTTLLQWRAQHLKNSISILLSSGQMSSDIQQITALTERLYANPFINSLNQEAKGKLARGFRKVAQSVTSKYYELLDAENPFRFQDSAPSYIPAEAFANSLITTFKLPEIGRAIAHSRLEEFKQKQIKDILGSIDAVELSEASKNLAKQELELMDVDWDKTIVDFKSQRSDFPQTIDRFSKRLEKYINNCQLYIEQSEQYLNVFIYRIQSIQDGIYGESERPALAKSLKPSINEVVDLIYNKAQVYDEFSNAVKDAQSPTHEGVRQLIETLPDLPTPVRNSLVVLGERIKTQKETIETEIFELQTQIETWFDSSMTRASGVYKRNARGIAILLGLMLAVSANADSLYIVSNLSRSSVVRTAISENARQLTAPNTQLTPQDFRNLAQNIEQSRVTDLPLGWNASIVSDQTRAEAAWGIRYLKRIIGWTVSGIAISMGASFWYDLLNKVVNVRNAGSSLSKK